MEGMIANSNLVVSAWHNNQLVGIARSLTDFHYACYLSDLAVSLEYQKSGIGKQLQILTQEQLGPKCKIILLRARCESILRAYRFYPKPALLGA